MYNKIAATRRNTNTDVFPIFLKVLMKGTFNNVTKIQVVATMLYSYNNVEFQQ